VGYPAGRLGIRACSSSLLWGGAFYLLVEIFDLIRSPPATEALAFGRLFPRPSNIV
jgi:hypothetical protein